MTAGKELITILRNAIDESLGSEGGGGAVVQVSVPDVDRSLRYLRDCFQPDAERKAADGSYEVDGSEDGVPWRLLVKRHV